MVESEKRLGRRDFLNAGLDIVAEGGFKALSATRVALELGVTTGSFYWHFESVPRFHEALLVYWKDEVIPSLPREAVKLAQGDPTKVLEKLGQVILKRRTHLYDTAIRKWAAVDPDVARVVKEADEWRQATMTGFLRDAGATDVDAADRINLAGAAWRGSENMDSEYRIRLTDIATKLD